MLVAAFLSMVNGLWGVVGCKGSEERSRFKIKLQNASKRVVCGRKMENLVRCVGDTVCCLRVCIV